MIVYRMTRSLHQELDGEGARQSGGRWNSPGTAVIYTSSTRALAALEYLVHIDVDEVPDDLVLISVEVPDTLPVNTVADDMRRRDGDRSAGDAWARGRKTIALGVPSRLIPEEWNYLINPRHIAAGEVRVVHVRDFVFDERLMGR
jgi:RES domain-containing protein